MIEQEQYQDIQIMQKTDFENTITFESPHSTVNYDYKVVIATDHVASPTLTLGVGSGLTKTDATTLTMKLTDDQTNALADNFEGVWELVSQASDGTLTREIQGDVVVSPGLVPIW